MAEKHLEIVLTWDQSTEQNTFFICEEPYRLNFLITNLFNFRSEKYELLHQSDSFLQSEYLCFYRYYCNYRDYPIREQI